MKPFEFYVAYVKWGDGGKRRPVLVLDKQEQDVSVFRITTQYQNKSAAIQKKYLVINDWQQSGLDKPSYIDTSKIIEVPISSVDALPIGALSVNDKQKLLESLSKQA